MTTDPLTFTERVGMASHRCDLCGALLLLIEIGPHYRTLHPNDAPRVTARQATRYTVQPYMTHRAACAECGAIDTGAGHDCEPTR